jgi:hypothetical protein
MTRPPTALAGLAGLTTLTVLVVLAVLVGGCSADPKAEPPPSPGRTPTIPTDVSSAVSAAFGDVVDDPGARLTGAYVERHGPTLSVNAYWICSHIRCGNQQVIASSADGFATADYVHLTRRTYAERMLPPRPLRVPRLRELRHLITSPVTSLRRGLLAVVAGGDGATLLPFQRVVRSTDAGATWRTFDIALTAGQRAYTSGQVVTSDGRLVALLDHWSGDRAGRPADRVHGLHASADTDWSSYHPLRARFDPPLVGAPRGFPSLVTFQASAAPDPVIWATTWDSRLYVSTDDAASFSEVPAR